MDMMIDGPIRRQARAIAEIRRPTDQKPVQSSAHLGPWPFIAGSQEIADLGLDPLNTLLGRACARVPMAVFPVAVRAECVAKEIEALAPGVPHRGFRLVERQPELRHHRSRPRQGLLRATAAEDDESSSGGGSHPSALTEPDVKLSPHPAPTLRPPVARRAATGQTGWGPAARCVPASASTRVLDV